MRVLAPLLGLAMFACGSRVMAQSDAQVLLDVHNLYRARHCAPALTWSPQIAAAAQQWANRCVFEHDPDNPLGENLAWGTQLSAGEAVDLWYEEAALYNYVAPGFGPAGHFTQLVWRGSKWLGCGRAACGGDILWVCRYSPAGNYDGQYRANVSPVCR